MKLQKKYMILVTMGMVFTLITGCVPKQQQASETLLNVKVISVDTDVPIPVHFFTLKSDNRIKKLDYFELIHAKEATLNSELISRSKTILLPGKTEIFQTQINEELQYYAIIVGFKDVKENDNWRYIQRIIPNRSNNIALKVSQKNAYQSKPIKKINVMQYTNHSVSKEDQGIRNTVFHKISNKVSRTKNRIIDRTIDKTIDKVFGNFI